jgi:EAL domain-containing protein (putative c-di-GMP-specific phosphodiesterase class I)
LSFSPGTTIFREGEPGDQAYIIERGKVEVSALKQGQRLVLAVLEEGDVLGEMALLDNERRTATATALEAAEVLVIPREELGQRLADADPLLKLLLRTILDRFRETHWARLAGDPMQPTQHRPGRITYSQDRQRAIDAVRLHQELERAVQDGQLRLDYQPIVRLGDRQIVALEGLIRWRHPERGEIAPGAFIPFAEETGYIVELGLWALDRAREAVLALERELPGRHIVVSVNISGAQLTDTERLERLLDRINTFAGDRSRLKLELTESLLMSDPVLAASSLARIKRTGVTLAIDDFGTGYSSLGYLQRFPIDTLKIDRTFVHGMLADPASLKIVRAIVSLAADLELDTIAEGVETEAHAARLVELRCRHAQGWLFARPQPLEEIVASLR